MERQKMKAAILNGYRKNGGEEQTEILLRLRP